MNRDELKPMSYVCLSDHLGDEDLLFLACNVYESTSSSTHIWRVFSQAHKSRIESQLERLRSFDAVQGFLVL